MEKYELWDGQWDTDTEVSFILEDLTGDLIDRLDSIRKNLGFTDLVCDADNDVWYNFYLIYTPESESIRITGTVNESEKDDWHSYDIELPADDLSVLKKMAQNEFMIMEDEQVD